MGVVVGPGPSKVTNSSAFLLDPLTAIGLCKH